MSRDGRRYGPPPAPAPRVDCPRCGGEGLREQPVTIRGRTYRETVACSCEAGRQYRPAIANAADDNAAEIRQLGYVVPTRDGPDGPAPIGTPPPPRREPVL